MHPGHPVVSQQQEGILTAEARAERGCRDCRRNLARDRTMLWPAWWPLCSREVFHPESGSNERRTAGWKGNPQTPTHAKTLLLMNGDAHETCSFPGCRQNLWSHERLRNVKRKP